MLTYATSAMSQTLWVSISSSNELKYAKHLTNFKSVNKCYYYYSCVKLRDRIRHVPEVTAVWDVRILTKYKIISS